jgi:hypothetical protein
MNQDVASYFLSGDQDGKTEMDYFVEGKMLFGKDEELPVAPPPIKSVKPSKPRRTSVWAPTQPKAIRSVNKPADKTPSKPQVRTGARSFDKFTRASSISAKPKVEKIVREDMRDEVSALEKEELAAIANDDFGMSFDLEL